MNVEVGRVAEVGRKNSEVVNESGASEQAADKRPIKAQSAVVARATASICNAEWTLFGGMSGRGGFVHSFSGSQFEHQHFGVLSGVKVELALAVQ